MIGLHAEAVTLSVLSAAADLMHVFSKLPRDLNFIDHTSNISWKAYVLGSLIYIRVFSVDFALAD